MAKAPLNTDTNAVPADDLKMVSNSQGKDLPETAGSGVVAPAVRDLPPANPLGEPVKPAESYPNVSEAGKMAAALGVETEETKGTDAVAGETIVEHPVSPTDAVPNPHGQRDEGEGTTVETDPNTKVSRRVSRTDTDTVEVTGMADNPVHLGDGRTLAKGQKAHVSAEVAKDLRDRKAAK